MSAPETESVVTLDVSSFSEWGFSKEVDLETVPLYTEMASPTWTPFLAFFLSAPFSYYIGILFKKFKMPAISGYLCVGLIIGPYVLGWLTIAAMSKLSAFQHSSLALIGVMAGAEINIPEITRVFRQVSAITCFISLSTWLFVYFAFLLMAPYIVYARDAAPSEVSCMASLTATLMIARSPASCIAVLAEVGDRGPFPSLVLAVTVLKDIVVVVAFAVNLELCVSIRGEGRLQLSFATFLRALVPVIIATLLGMVGGSSCAIAIRVSSTLPRKLPQLLTPAIVVVFAGISYQVAERLNLEGLLVCLFAGAALSNQPGQKHSSDLLDHSLRQLAPINNVLFFTFVGASLPLTALEGQFRVAFLIFVVRLLSIYVGTWTGIHIAGCMPRYVNLMWLSMVTQAGVALGLVARIQETFPEWSETLVALQITVICFNQAIGPTMFRFALLRNRRACIKMSSTAQSTQLCRA